MPDDELKQLKNRLEVYRSASIEGQAMAYAGLAMIVAIQRLEKSSSRLTYWQIGLSIVITILTLVLTWLTYLLARKGGP